MDNDDLIEDGDWLDSEEESFQNDAPKIPSRFVEECLALPISSLGKRLFWLERDAESGLWEPKRGTFPIIATHGTGMVWVNFQVVLADQPYVDLSVPYNDNHTMRSKIMLTCKQLHYGERPYWLCRCGQVVAVLYHRPGYYGFACRKCLNLIYYLQSLNRKSGLNVLAYQMNRMQKVKELGIFRFRPIVYKGKPTRRYTAFLKALNKYQVKREDFEALLTQLKAGKTRIRK